MSYPQRNGREFRQTVIRLQRSRRRRRGPFLDSFARGFAAAVALCLGAAGFVLGLYWALGAVLP